MIDIVHILAEHCQVIEQLSRFIPLLQQTSQAVIGRIQQGGTVFWMGNGGSAADAQHMAAELIGRFACERPAIASIALTTDSSILTCLSNDYDFARVFARQLEGLCKAQDIVIGLSTSGNSENVLRGIALARQRGALTIGFSGETGGQLQTAAEVCFCIPSRHTPRIQEATTLLCHVLCEMIEAAVVSAVSSPSFGNR